MEDHPSGIPWGRVGIILIALIVLIGVIGGGAYFLVTRTSANGEARSPGRDGGSTGIKVEVIEPKPGGIPRVVTQPGSVEPFVRAEIFAKVNGRLKTLKVDIGDRVKAGDLLGEIEIPELEAQAARNKAKIEDVEAKYQQSLAQKAEAEAEARAAESAEKLAEILVKAKTAFRSYRERQLNRIKDLVARKAEDQRLQDEQEDYYLSALEAENAAKEKVLAEQERTTAARVKIQRVEADIKASKASIDVARAEWENSKVWVEYGKILAPFDGIITQRGFYQWDFIKAGDQGGTTPILTLTSTRVLRVVIPVPDRDAPFVQPGKPAVLTFDALPGVVYKTEGDNKVVVSRISDAEDYQTRLMRVEVDVQNKDGRLKQGMFGQAKIILTQGAPNAVNIPSSALTGRANEGKGTVRVVRDGKIETIPVEYGMDDGRSVEINSGLTVQDQVVIGMNVPVKDGAPVTVTKAAK
jgi:HlyD family secretion protein